MMNLSQGDDIYIVTDPDGEQVNGKNGNDTITGGPGLDSLNGGPGNDLLKGGDGDDTLQGAQGNDILEGGDGNDWLKGAEGNNTFIFNFSVDDSAGASESFTGDFFAGSVVGGEVADGTSQNTFSVQYTNWLNHLVDTYDLGSDANGDGIIGVGLNQNDPNGTPTIEGLSATELEAMFGSRESFMAQTGRVQQERWYSDVFSWDGGPQITASDGNDIVVSFNDSNVNNTDALELHGITQAQAAALFTYQTGDFDLDGVADDSLISWEGATNAGDGSITVVGETWADLGAFLNDSRVDFIL